MKEFWKKLTGKQIILGITAAVSLAIFIVLTIVSCWMSGQLKEQNMAQRWDDEGKSSQISCFFSQNSQVDENLIQELEHKIDQKLMEASITVESPNASARLWADAYSAFGRLNIEGSSGKVEVNTLGVGGDFFLFHPLKLVNGTFFSGDDLMQDHIVIDSETAWKLFGSNDVVGQQVMIQGVPYLINGVIERDHGRFNDAAGNGESIAYVSYETLKKNDSSVQINHYEIVMPNPIKGFAIGLIMELLTIDEKDRVVLENTTRFQFIPMIKNIRNFGIRSMNGKAIIYPYWENIARGYEEVLGVILIFQILVFVYPMVLFVILIVYLWRHKTWNRKDIKKFWYRFNDFIGKRKIE